MKTSTRVAALALALLCSAPVLAQTAPAGSGTEVYSAFDAAVAREKQALEARDRALATAKSDETLIATAEREEAALRAQQLAAAQQTEREIVALLDRIEGGRADPRKLLTEQAVLQDWYDTLQPAVAHLTERSFRGVEVQLDALAASGAIEPGAHRFRSYLELRNRLSEVGKRIADNRAQAQQAASTLRGQVQPLMARRERELANLARVDPRVMAAVDKWYASARELEARGNELLEARKALEAALDAVLDAAGTQRPPFLSEVTASVDGNTIYTASWQRGDGRSDSERERENKRAALAKSRDELAAAIVELEAQQRALHSACVESAEKMQRRSAELQRSAARFSAKLENRFWTELGLDVGLTVAEIVVTGGTATLARKSATLAQEAAARTEAAAGRRAATAVASPLEASVMQRMTIPGDAISDSLRRAANLGTKELEDEAETWVRKLISEGASEAAARQQVSSVYRPLITKLADNERNSLLANRIQASILALEKSDISLKEVLGNGWDASKEELASKLAGDSAQHVYEQVQQARGTAGNDTAGTVALGEGFKTALSLTANTWSAESSQAAAAAGRAAKLGSKAWNGLGANATNLGVAAVGSIIQIAAANKLDKGVDSEAVRFSELMGELDYWYAIYRAQVGGEHQVELAIVDLQRWVANIKVQIKLLDGGLQLDSRPTPSRVSLDGSLQLQLGFSAPLAAAPTVSLGGVAVSMQRADQTGLHWHGTVPVRSLGRGAKPLSVAATAAATRFGALDSDPGTPAIRLLPNASWRGFEAAADTRHVIPLMAGDPPPPVATPASDPFEEGRALVDAGAAEVQPGAIRASDLAGEWTGTGYSCENAQPPEKLRIVVTSAQELVATKTHGDNCIRTGEVTWRGRLSGSTIQGEFHVRSPGAAANEDSWLPGSWEVISRDEIRGFGVIFRRD